MHSEVLTNAVPNVKTNRIAFVSTYVFLYHIRLDNVFKNYFVSNKI